MDHGSTVAAALFIALVPYLAKLGNSEELAAHLQDCADKFSAVPEVPQILKSAAEKARASA